MCEDLIKAMNEKILYLKNNVEGFEQKDLSDGHHTFRELYEFRKMYNAALFNEWAKTGKYDVHKSTKHYDGKECFGGGRFIVSAKLPNGLISNHYKIKDWELFKVPIVYCAKYKFDGHTGKDVLERISQIL